MNLSAKFVQNIDLAISVMRDAGKWLLYSGKTPSEYFQLHILNREYLLKHAEPNDFYVGLVEDKPAVACLLQDNERNQSWKSVDGVMPKSALYIHWLCVNRQFAGKGLPEVLISFALQEAKKRKLPLIRLDTETNKTKLRNIYEKLGFKLMGVEGDTVFYQKTA